MHLTGIACLAFALLGVLSIRDPVGAGGRWRPQRPSVPGPIRARFARASLTGASVWGVGGRFLSVVPAYAGHLLHTGDLALLGAIAGLLADAYGLSTAVAVIGAIVAAVATMTALWHLAARRSTLVEQELPG